LQFIDHRALIGQDPETSRGENQEFRQNGIHPNGSEKSSWDGFHGTSRERTPFPHMRNGANPMGIIEKESCE
jgi:hypothetical protein